MTKRFVVKGIQLSLRDIFLGLAVIFLALTILRGNVNQDKAFHRADRAACIRIEALKSLARDQLRRAKVTLPTLYYYQQNPDELHDQIAAINRQLQDFRPTRC